MITGLLTQYLCDYFCVNTMATYPSVSTYVEDLNALILQHKHKLVSLTAEIHVLNTFLQKHSSKCDDLASDLKKVDSDLSSSSNSDNVTSLKTKRAAMYEELLSSYSKRQYFKETLMSRMEECNTIQRELNILKENLVHVVDEHM